MKNKISQRDRILKQLRENGSVSRNACIRGDYGTIITRLGAIICDLRKDGMDIEMKEFTNPIETIYTLKDTPKIERFIVKGANDDGSDKIIERKIWG